MNKAFLLGTGMVVLLAACTKQGQPSTIEGEWAITRVAPALPDRLPDKVGLKEAMALFILSAHGDSLLPSMITINSKDMVLKAISPAKVTRWPTRLSDRTSTASGWK